jgi:hypothetical protein
VHFENEGEEAKKYLGGIDLRREIRVGASEGAIE